MTNNSCKILFLFFLSIEISGKDFNAINFEAQNVKNDSIKKCTFGIKLSQHFNYPVLHTTPSFSIYIKNHNIYIGPEFTYLLNPLYGDPVYKWQNKYIGLNIGYRYIIKSTWKRLNFYLSMNFSIYQIKYEEYQMGPPYMTNHEKLIIENTIGVGLNYQILKRINLFGEIGTGSTDKFFLMLQQFVPHTSIGVEFIIK